jgi:hypothetical protein
VSVTAIGFLFLTGLVALTPLASLYWGGYRCPRAFVNRKVVLVSSRIRDSAVRVHPCRIEYTYNDHFTVYDEPRGFLSVNKFFYKDEGITWCFGHEGKAVDALRVVQALKAA